MPNRINLTRRKIVVGLAAAGPASALAPIAAQSATVTPATSLCVLTPQMEEGPFYLDPRLERANITEGHTGVSLKLKLAILDAGDCKPLVGARVDIWHADAIGFYSGYDGQGDGEKVSTKGQTFLRGTQFANGAGEVAFETIYPGWYRGRTTHIHFKVYLDQKSVLTGQIYFPDALSQYIYDNVAPYNKRTVERDTWNATDHVVKQGGGGHESFCSIKEDDGRYLASLVIAADRNASGEARMTPPPAPDTDDPPPQGSSSRPSLVPGAPRPE